MPELIPLWIILGLIAIAFIVSYICFYRIFYFPQKKRDKLLSRDPYQIPPGRIYDEHREQIVKWIKDSDELPHKKYSITSFDGLTLRGRFYEYSPDAPIEILFHGYQGNSRRDLCGGIFRCFDLGHSAFLIDNRSAGESDGNVITFGINERRDCLDWIKFTVENINPDAKIILTGVSMGAATVMMAASEDLPENVVGVLADCGYTSAKDIIKLVMKSMKLPAGLLYPFAILGAKIFGRFNLDEYSPIESMKKCKLPIMFIHGDDDRFVPREMSVRNFEACASERKVLVTVSKAGHGLCYPVNVTQYTDEMRDFFEPLLYPQKTSSKDHGPLHLFHTFRYTKEDLYEALSKKI